MKDEKSPHSYTDNLLTFPLRNRIPRDSIIALNNRFIKGEEHYGEQAWNSLSDNWEKLDDGKWIVDRFEHALAHLEHFISVLVGRVPDDGDDDGAAIMWFGCLAHEVWMRRKGQRLEGPE